MTQEEKAKAYDEALKKLHEIITMDNHPVLPKEIGEFLFPELTENKKEKTKIEIIQFFRDASNGKTRVINSNTFAEWADYLENKEEQKSAERSVEDEDYLEDVKTAVYDYFDEGYAEELYNWLKFLRPQLTEEDLTNMKYTDAKKIAYDVCKALPNGEEKDTVVYYAILAAMAGAKWMAEQGYSQEETVEDKCLEVGYGALPGISPIINLPDSFKPGEKVIVQIRKKEE